MTDRPVEVSVLMPCLNEAATVATCVAKARAALERAGLVGEVIVADNGSDDGSADLARGAGARVVAASPRGYGAAYLAALAEARGRYLVLGDADDTYDFGEVPRFVAALKGGADVVLGSRLKGTIAAGAMPWLHRYVGNPVLSGILGLLFRQRVSDAHCGLRALSRQAAERMRLKTHGMEFASEMVARAARAGLTVGEIPISYYPRRGRSKLRRFRDGWRHLRFMLLLSPAALFILPGLMSLLAGAAGLVVLLPGPVRLGSGPGALVFDFHFMFVASALAILGAQLLVLGVGAKTYARLSALDRGDAWLERFYRHFTLERGIVAGAALLAVGLGTNAAILISWLASGRGALFAVRPAIVGLTCLVLGAELVFGSFFLSMLRDEPRTDSVRGEPER